MSDINVQSFSGKVKVSNDLTVTTNVHADYFKGDGSLLTNLPSGSGGVWSTNGDGEIYFINSNVGISNADPGHNLSVGSNLYVDDDGSNVLVVTGNVKADYFVGNGSLLTGLSGSGGVWSTNGDGEIYFINSNVGISNADPGHNLSVGSNLYIDDDGSNVLVVTGNVKADYFVGNGSLLTNLPSGSGGVWSTNGDGEIYFINSNVGISNADPGHNLSVGSNLYVDDDGLNVLVVDGNVAAESINIGGISIKPSYPLSSVTDTGNVTPHTIQFTNTETGFVVDSNIVVTGNVTAGYLYGDASNVTGIAANLHQIVENGNVTSNTVQFSNATTGLVTTANVEVGGELTVSGNLEVGTGYSDQLIPRMSGRVNNVNITALNERTRTSYATANNAVSTWTSRTIEASGWNSVTWSPELSLFVAVATNGTNRAATSPDGVTWTNRTIYTGSKWESVTWSPELSIFVAVANTSLIATPNNLVTTSPDGVIWTNRTIESSSWKHVTWSPELSLFVVVATSGTNRVATSPDGITWTTRSIDANIWRHVTWSPELSLFVAVANSGTNQVATSPDGITWTSRSIEASGWSSVTWSPELSLFVAVAFSGTNRVATSPDGITWTGHSIDANSWYDVTWSSELSLFVAVASNGTYQVATSINGIDWTGHSIEASGWNTVTWSPELSLFVAAAFSGTNRVATSNLGIPVALNTPMSHPGQLHVDTVNSRVGVGTTSPNATLHVKNETDSSGAGDAYISGVIKKPTECLRLQNKWHNTGSGALLRFTNQHPQGTNPSTGEYNLAGIAGYDHDGSWGGGLAFYTSPGSGSGGDDLTLRMSIDSIGAVNLPGPTTGASHGSASMLYLLDTPLIKEWQWTGSTNNTLQVTFSASELPTNCKAIYADVFMPQASQDDHVGHALGKNHGQQTMWTGGRNARPSTAFGNLALQQCFLSMPGQSDAFEYFYGNWWNSCIIPLDTQNRLYHTVSGETSGSQSWIYIVVKGYFH